jgi:hypothetical protein
MSGGLARWIAVDPGMRPGHVFGDCPCKFPVNRSGKVSGEPRFQPTETWPLWRRGRDGFRGRRSMKPGNRRHNARYLRDYFDAGGFTARLADWLAEREGHGTQYAGLSKSLI